MLPNVQLVTSRREILPSIIYGANSDREFNLGTLRQRESQQDLLLGQRNPRISCTIPLRGETVGPELPQTARQVLKDERHGDERPLPYPLLTALGNPESQIVAGAVL